MIGGTVEIDLPLRLGRVESIGKTKLRGGAKQSRKASFARAFISRTNQRFSGGFRPPHGAAWRASMDGRRKGAGRGITRESSTWRGWPACDERRRSWLRDELYRAKVESRYEIISSLTSSRFSSSWSFPDSWSDERLLVSSMPWASVTMAANRVVSGGNAE